MPPRYIEHFTAQVIDATAFLAHEVVVRCPRPEFVHGVPMSEQGSQQNALLRELAQHAVHGRQAHWNVVALDVAGKIVDAEVPLTRLREAVKQVEPWP